MTYTTEAANHRALKNKNGNLLPLKNIQSNLYNTATTTNMTWTETPPQVDCVLKHDNNISLNYSTLKWKKYAKEHYK